ncbi:MAG: twin-arginine translocase subunit TatC [Chthoniobacterales bacterium]
MKFGKKFFSFRETGDSAKPFLDHLEDLRTVLIKCLLTLGGFMVIGFIFRFQIAKFVQHPLVSAVPEGARNLQSLAVADAIMISFELAFYAGLIMAFPFLLFFLAEFILPGLTRAEKKAALPAALVGFALFIAGASFAYFGMLPPLLRWCYAQTVDMGWAPSWTVRDYYAIATQTIIGFGLAFELPVVIVLLAHIGLINTPQLRSFRPYALVLSFLLAGIIIQTTDLLVFVMVAMPIYLLYEISIIAAYFLIDKKKLKEAKEKALTDSLSESDK